MALSKYLSKAEQLSQEHLDDDAMLDNMQDLIDSAERFLRSTASYSGAEIESARARVVSQLDAARDHARKHRRSRVYRRASEMAETSGRYVSEHKWQSAGVLAAAAALAAGLYAGMKWSEERSHWRR